MSEEITNSEETSSEEPKEASFERSSTENSENRTSAQRSDPRGGDQRGERPSQGDRKQRRVPRFRKKVCKFCHNKDVAIDYKRPDVLERFLTERGKILPRRITGTCAKHQRRIATEVKRSRMIALLPFVEL